MANQKKNRTTAEHFQIFVEECQYWIKYFGIYGYAIRFFHIKLDNGLAQTNVNSNRSERVAGIYLNTNFINDSPTEKILRESAFHEVAELLTWRAGDIIAQCGSGYQERDVFHELIRILENTVFQESYNRRFGNVERTSTANTKRKARSRSGKKRS